MSAKQFWLIVAAGVLVQIMTNAWESMVEQQRARQWGP